MAPLEYLFMAGKAQESKLETSTSGRVGDTGGKQLKGNGHRDGGLHHSSTCSKTSTGFSECHIDNEAGEPMSLFPDLWVLMVWLWER